MLAVVMYVIGRIYIYISDGIYVIGGIQFVNISFMVVATAFMKIIEVNTFSFVFVLRFWY